jgi:serine/threonine protein kinase/Tfp pilus assembly protein PilF
MDTDSHQRIRRIFDLVFEAPPADRHAILSRECGADHALSERVRAMIAAAEGAEFLADPTIEALHEPAGAPTVHSGGSAALREGPGTRIGPYKLLQLIGEGGFGSVFMAEQERPIARKVALKIIKLGMDTRAIIARFEAERQALAMMDHPHIARVLDVGATDTGRPYFVMDLVKGDPIAEYCDKHNLTIPARLELFAQVCEAVQHAHTKGIIHRDIKPSNILVSTQDGRAAAKVIDFGIAKATSSRLTEKTLFTEHRQLIGTPEYMSPEQADGSLDIDTRTDVYSLGVLLYELLTGSTPFDSRNLRSAAYAEIQRIIREEAPHKPSTRLSQSADTLASVAAHRQIEPRKLGTLVRGELDWIVMKALEKNRARRYETANGLAMDVRRYLAGEAVVAAPPSRRYRIGKFVGRHRGAVVGTGAVGVALAAGVVAFAWQAKVAGDQRDLAVKARQAAVEEKAAAERATQRASTAEAEARQRAEEVQKAADFQAAMLGTIDMARAGLMLSGVIRAKLGAALAKSGADESQRERETGAFEQAWSRVDAIDVCRDLLDRTVLSPAVLALDREFKDRPALNAKLRHAVANQFSQVGLYERAAEIGATALAMRRRALGEDHPETVDSIASQGLMELDAGRRGDAEPLFREALEKRRRLHGPDDPRTLAAINAMGSFLRDTGDLKQAETYYREAWQRRRAVLGEDDPSTVDSLNNVALIAHDLGRYEEAERCYREALDRGRQRLADSDPAMLGVLNNLALALAHQGKFNEAESTNRAAAEQRRAALGEDHPSTLESLGNLAVNLVSLEKFADAEKIMREVWDVRRTSLGPEHPSTLTSVNNLGALLQRMKRFPEAERLLQQALAGRRRVLGPDHHHTLLSMFNVGYILANQQRTEEAEAMFLECERRRERTLGEEHPHTIATVRALAQLYESWEQRDPGKGHGEKAERWKKKLPAQGSR